MLKSIWTAVFCFGKRSHGKILSVRETCTVEEREAGRSLIKLIGKVRKKAEENSRVVKGKQNKIAVCGPYFIHMKTFGAA